MNKSDYRFVEYVHLGRSLRFLGIALEGFHSLSWLNNHMGKKVCDVCAQATTNRLAKNIDDQGFLDQCCDEARVKIKNVQASKRIGEELPGFLDELEAIYRPMADDFKW